MLMDLQCDPNLFGGFKLKKYELWEKRGRSIRIYDPMVWREPNNRNV